jgi:hypothetical protein
MSSVQAMGLMVLALVVLRSLCPLLGLTVRIFLSLDCLILSCNFGASKL